ncbi:hypothetical protein CT0861_01812 [Colletotrichum tofieldiae]|uniref:Uncharacterized protein n=1 Tax=Colletotrichum tofieldiae TaxID=708197 RepID=A0A161YM50_9PEZI|nr:hypothetical protein CT0861_01812 [Colletotrichum tofieldiae]
MRFQYLALSLFAASTVTAAAVPLDVAAAVEERDVPCGCLPDYIGNSYGCGSFFPGQNYCQQMGVAGDYPVCCYFITWHFPSPGGHSIIANYIEEVSAVQLERPYRGQMLHCVQCPLPLLSTF